VLAGAAKPAGDGDNASMSPGRRDSGAQPVESGAAEEILMGEREPVCLICGVAGWELVCPLGNPAHEHGVPNTAKV
jgi:hypothetical protein